MDLESTKMDERNMKIAMRLAEDAFHSEEVPVGALIVHQDGRILGKASNQTETLKDPTAHAEILAITQAAAAMGDWRLEDTVLYITKEPCPMCAGAIVLARIPRVVWAVGDPKRGGQTVFNLLDSPSLNHRPLFQEGPCTEEGRFLLQQFFRNRREKK